MSKKSLPAAASVEERVRPLISARRPRPVITPRGKRARGCVPSYKTLWPRFESLVEEDVVRVLEVASTVRSFTTHPFVLDLSEDGERHEYTPDAFAMLTFTAAVIEAKGEHWLTVPSARLALARHASALRRHRIPLALFLDRDVRKDSLSEELKLLLRDRPVCNRRLRATDPNAWDPSGRTTPTGLQLRRWRDAQKACDALLDRVMRRDPDELLELATQ